MISGLMVADQGGEGEKIKEITKEQLRISGLLRPPKKNNKKR